MSLQGGAGSIGRNTPGRVRLTRDRPTWLVYLMLGTFATYLYGLSAALPLLQIEQGVSQTVAGLHGTSMAIGGLLTGLALSWMTARIGRRAVAWIGLAGMNCGVLLVAFTGALPLTLLGYGVASGAGSITLYATMAVLSDHHGPTGPAAMAEANAVGVSMGIAVSFVLSAFAQTALGWRAALFIPPVMTGVIALFMGRVWVPAAESAQSAQSAPSTARAQGAAAGETDSARRSRDAATTSRDDTSTSKEPFGRRFYLAGIALFCCVGLEFCFNLWSAKLLADQTGLSAAVAATGLTAFTAGIAVGRFSGARLALWLPPARLLVGALLVTTAGWALFWMSARPVVSYAGLVVSGIGVALLFPLGLSRVIAASGGRPDRASAAASIWASLAAGMGPSVLGALSDGFGTHSAFLMIPIMAGVAASAVLVGARPPRGTPARR